MRALIFASCCGLSGNVMSVNVVFDGLVFPVLGFEGIASVRCLVIRMNSC